MKLGVHTCMHMENEQSMVLKSVSYSLDPEVWCIIQLTFFFITYQKLIFQF